VDNPGLRALIDGFAAIWDVPVAIRQGANSKMHATRHHAPGRRSVLLGAAAAGLAPNRLRAEPAAEPIFDSHFHIIDPKYKLIANEGYVPPPYPLSAYLAAARPLGVTAGAVVSGSFQGFDQTYLRATLAELGPGWAGVAQVPPDISDESLTDLSHAGVRALRFNMYRGRIDSVDDLVSLASRAHAVAGWHAEIYADAAALAPHVDRLTRMGVPLSIDHLGMTQAGLPVLLDLVSAGVKVKATGFGRVKMDVPRTLEAIAARAPNALIFGTDLPSTRAARAFEAADIDLLRQVLGHDLARRALWDNARAFYA
jgi:predicted TIM-barrel fold metal-dependent hydrolase